MNLGIDISAMGERNYTGVGVYVENLIKNLAEIDTDNRYYLCYRFSRLKYGLFSNPVRRKNFHLKIIQEPLNFFFQRKLDVFHGPGERLPDFPHPKKVVTIHDLAAVKGGDFMTDEFRDMIKARYRELISGGGVELIITISESTKSDICDYYGVDPARVKVAYLGVDPVFRPQSEESVQADLLRLGIKRPYIFNAGALQERKNIVRIIRAYHRYRQAGGEAGLVLCGKPAYGYERIPATIAELGLGDKVTIIGHLAQKELVSLYSGAEMLCFPSLYEGFGLPILEAFACGCPVITSNITSMPEVAGEAAVLVEPTSEEEISAAMLRLSEKGERDFFVKAGLERVQRFTWEKTARSTLEIYRSLAG